MCVILCNTCKHSSVEDPWDDFNDLVIFCNRPKEDGTLYHEYKGAREIAHDKNCKVYTPK